MMTSERNNDLNNPSHNIALEAECLQTFLFNVVFVTPV